MKKIYLTLVALACFVYAKADPPTFEEIFNMVQVKCVSCHSYPSPAGNLNMEGSMSDLYNALVEVSPTNPAAAAKGDKLIDPGYPERSFLLRKIAFPEWDDGYSLDVAEGNLMPNNQPHISKVEAELIRQWVLHGAPSDETVVSLSLLEDFYNNGLALPGIDAPPAPPEGEGFQIRLGPFFLGPQGEVEYFKKHDLRLDQGTEVNRTEAFINDESHHFIIYRLGEASIQNYGDGLRNIEDGDFSITNNPLVAVWQNNGDFSLPEYTAFKWPGGVHLDLNYHLVNYSVNGILPAEVYVNVYTQPEGTAVEEMFSVLIPINILETIFGAPIGNGLVIPNNGDEITFTDEFAIPDVPFTLPFPSGTWHVWMLSSHTHARGTDFDIYRRNSDGTKGEQLYEGFYDFNYIFNQGFYDWSHPPIRFFDELNPVQIDLSAGIVMETKYINDGPDTLYWGNTTEDEMMLMIAMMTANALPGTTSAVEPDEGNASFRVYPNPFGNGTQIAYELKQSSEVSLEVFNMLGEQVESLHSGTRETGNYQHSLDGNQLPPGMYLLRLSIDEQVYSRKIVKVE